MPVISALVQRAAMPVAASVGRGHPQSRAALRLLQRTYFWSRARAIRSVKCVPMERASLSGQAFARLSRDLARLMLAYYTLRMVRPRKTRAFYWNHKEKVCVCVWVGGGGGQICK
jgi:hypothetical protein